MNNIYAKPLKDSIATNGKRLTSFEIQLPKVLIAENNTHRATSKNFMSSRAIPNGKFTEIESFEPQYYGKNIAGMQSSGELVDDVEAVRAVWDDIIGYCKVGSERLSALGLHKQWTNRPNDWHVMAKGVLTATDWDNLLWLRNDDSAQPEYHELARLIQEHFDNSEPEPLKTGEWHLPFISTVRDRYGVLQYLDSSGGLLSLVEAQQISASCCAQVSYRKLNDTKEEAIRIYEKLFSGTKLHMSPCEHQGTPICAPVADSQWFPETWQDGVTHVRKDGRLCSGNFVGWVQYRQTLPNNVFDLGQK
jgi:hypothetical protein